MSTAHQIRRGPRDDDQWIGYPLSKFQGLLAEPIDVKATFELFRRTGKITMEVTGEVCACFRRKTGTDPCRVLVQDKYRKDVAENHADQYQPDAAQKEETTGA